MTAVFPHMPPAHPGSPSRLSARLDVRIDGGRWTSYSIEGAEFLIGSAVGCDLRIPGAQIPPVVCQFSWHENELRLRRLAGSLPVTCNQMPISGPTPVVLGPGDQIVIGTAELVVGLVPVGHLHPQFRHPKPELAACDPPPIPNPPDVRDRSELDKYRESLERQARELEADRVAWYRRREEIELEYRKAKSEPQLASRDETLRTREADLAEREQLLEQTRGELVRIRQSLIDQYHARRDQIAQMRAAIQEEILETQSRQARREAELDERGQRLEEEVQRIHDSIEAEVSRRMADTRDEVRRHKIELEIQFASRLQELETTAGARQEQFERDIASFALIPQIRGADSGDVPAPAVSSLPHPVGNEQARESLAGLRRELERDRQALDAERHWIEQRQQEHEALLHAREEELARRESDLASEADEFNEARRHLAGEHARIVGLHSALQERQRELDHRAGEVDRRAEQLARDASDLEKHLALFQAERQQLTAETERSERNRKELDARTNQIAERAAQVEAQQATLAVLRARLDRQEQDLHNETAQLMRDRARTDASQRELDDRLREADQLRLAISTTQSSTTQDRQSLEEESKLLAVTMAELQNQRIALAAEEERLRALESELDSRSADLAEQTAVLTARLGQVKDLHDRLEADRKTVRERENGMNEAEAARVSFQEQIRRRADEITIRGKQLDEAAARFTHDRQELERQRAAMDAERQSAELTLAAAKKELDERSRELDVAQASLAERETVLNRQVKRLQEAGRAVAAGRKQLFEGRQTLEQDREALTDFHNRARAEIEKLGQQAPELEDRSTVVLERLSAARELLRGLLTELHTYAAQSRDTLEAVRIDLRTEADRLRQREAEITHARSEHSLAVAEFRQQLLDWQARVSELRSTISRSESRIDAKQAALDAATRHADQTAQALVRQAEILRHEQDVVNVRRTEVERHLSEMREWYRNKMRELATAPTISNSAPTTHDTSEPDPGDRQLGEFLRSLDLVDAETLSMLWAEAGRQHRTLRQVILASGAITLYQLALIEAGNLDALMIGRFQVLDRVRLTPRESVFRVQDPARSNQPGPHVLRILGETEMHDATHPDEFRQRFALAAELDHRNLMRTWELLEIGGRPAVLQEWVAGVPASDWPHELLTPGIWTRAVASAASSLDVAHRVGLPHGRLVADSVLLTTSGDIKIIGIGEPQWLATGLPAAHEPTPEADLRALGRIATDWAMHAIKKKGKSAKGLPDAIQSLLQRMVADPQNPMADTSAMTVPFESMTDLLTHLNKLTEKYPCSNHEWMSFVRRTTSDDGAEDEQQRIAS